MRRLRGAGLTSALCMAALFPARGHAQPPSPPLVPPVPLASPPPASPPPPHALPAGPQAPVAPAPARAAERAGSDANFVHFEVLGNAGLYSLSYSRLLFDDVAARIGVSYVALGAGIERAGARADVLTVPLMAHYLGVGSGPHRLDLGLGALLLYASATARAEASEIARAGFTVVGTATLGYRYLPPTGFTFNIGFTPIFGPILVPWGGVGIGHTF